MKDVCRLGALGLWVGDLERSAAFYRDIIGLPLVYSDPHEPENVPHYETMWGEWGEQGPVEPYLWFNLYAQRETPTSGVQLGFPIPNLNEVHERALASGVKVLAAPRSVPWGQAAVYEDPDGNLVEVTEY